LISIKSVVKPIFESISSIDIENQSFINTDSSFKVDKELTNFNSSFDAFEIPIKVIDKSIERICSIGTCLNIVVGKNWNKCKKHEIKHEKECCKFCDKKISKQNVKQHHESCSTKILEEDPLLKRKKNKNRHYCPDCYACPLKRHFSEHIDTCKESRFTKEKCDKCNKLVVLNASYVLGSKTNVHKHVCKEADLSKRECNKCKKLIFIEKYDDHVLDNKCFRPKLRNIRIYKNGRKKLRETKLHNCFYCKINTLESKRIRHLRKCKIFRTYLLSTKRINKNIASKYTNVIE
jgi:hypothetical protein